jgi:hypothetical protein
MPDWIAGSDDDFPSIALAQGFFWRTLWDHAENAQLRAERQNPNILYPGERVFVPILETKSENRPCQKRHRFRRKGEPAKIKIRLMDGGEPRANVPYRLMIEDKEFEGTTSAEGEIEVGISGRDKQGKLILNDGEEVFDVAIGRLDPIDQVIGVQERLSNLGYECHPYTNRLDAMTRRALINFQTDQKLKATGEPDDATKAKLAELMQ